MINVKAFLSRVEQICNEEPAYQKGRDGTDGLCDCIGLIIGAIRRCGGRWPGLHGSNYAARNEMRSLQRIVGNGDLQPGDVVYKSWEPGQPKYDLPDRYKPGGHDYNGDVRDYYHVGVVTSVYPIRIRHMTTPSAKTDTRIGAWGWVGRLKKVEDSAREEKEEMGKVIIAGGNVQEPIHMRATASTGSRIIAEIPQGTEVELLESGGTWNQVQWGNKTGYVMSIFVHRENDPDGETMTVSRERLKEAQELIERANDIISDFLGMRG